MRIDAPERCSVPDARRINRTIRVRKSSYYVAVWPGTLFEASIIREARWKKLVCRTAVVGAALCVSLWGSACLCAPEGYLGRVCDALDSLQSGLTNEALDSLNEAIEFNANDSLAHTAIGLTLLAGGRADDATAEFEAACELDGGCAEAMYGRALVYLSKGEFRLARAAAISAQNAGPDRDMRSAIKYAKAVESGNYDQAREDTADESLQAIRAVALMKQERYSEATPIWKELQQKAVAPGFRERIGCTMTFVGEQPVALTGWPVTVWPVEEEYLPGHTDKWKPNVVKGKVNLKADTSGSEGVEMVSFFVDNTVVGITNCRPYRYSWNTTRVANGSHTIRIEGCDRWGNVVSEKTTTVVVRNAGSKAGSGRVVSKEAARVWRRLWEAMRLKPSAAAINYNLAVCAMDANDPESAAEALERVMAANPDYPDAAELLSKVYGASGEHVRLEKCDTDDKVIVLTFDDGPKPHTTKLLDALKEIGVKATFFVVGKQAEAYPELVKRMVAEGHEVQNHTYSHPNLDYLSEKEVTQETFRTAAVVRSITGSGTRFVRPPGGHEGRALGEVMRKFGLTTALWSVNCSKVEGTTRERLRDHVLSGAGPGSIVLMHNLETVALLALPEIVDTLRGRGYSFVTLSEGVGRAKK